MQARTLIPVLMLSIALIGSNSMLLSPVLQDVAQSLATDAVSISQAMAAYGAATAISALLLGGLIDRFGAPFVILPAMALLATGMLCSAISQTLWQLCLAQVLAGIAAGLLLPSIYTVATRSGDAEQGAKSLSKVMTGWSISLVAGIPFSALVSDLFNWRVSYLLLLVITVVLLPVLRRLQRYSAPAGSATVSRYPLKTLAINGVPVLMFIQLLFMGAFYGVYAFLADALRSLHDLSAAMASLVVIAYGAGFGLASFAAGLSRRGSPSGVLLVMLSMAALVYALMPLAIESLIGALAMAFIWGSVNHFIVNLVVMQMSRCDAQSTGSILALSSAMAYLGAFAGPLLAGLLLQAGGIGWVLEGAAAALMLAVLALLVTRQRRAAAHQPAG